MHNRTYGIVFLAIHLSLACTAYGYGIGIREPSFSSQDLVQMTIWRYIGLIGGDFRLKSISSAGYSGVFIQDLSWKKARRVTEPFDMIARAPDRLDICKRSRSGFSLKRYADTSLIEYLEDGRIIDRGSRLRRLPILLNPVRLIQLLTQDERMVLHSIEEIDGRLCICIRLEGRSLEKWLLAFDSTSGLLYRVGYHLYLDDYRKIAGIRLPFRIIRGRKGGSSRILFKRIEFVGMKD